MDPQTKALRSSSKNDDTIIRSYAAKILSDENPKSFMSAPMKTECKMAIAIPAYDESPKNILRTLMSFAHQKGVDPDTYEVDYIFNNTAESAEQQTA